MANVGGNGGTRDGPCRYRLAVGPSPDGRIFGPNASGGPLGTPVARLSGVRRHIPPWATQFAVGMALVLIAVGIFAALLGAAVRGPTAFFDELGKTVARLGPQAQPDIRDDGQLKAVIRAMPDGKIQVGSIVEEKDEVVFTVTAPRSAVKAAVKPGDQLRIARDGGVEIVPTGIPGFFDELQRNIEDLKRKFFGGP